ncbi:hypothetical protein DI09_12p100 [Mitosporidium daphniae]|uniref:Uncharacterized protein n=1 Tax=Mitosporidium daphniae TaxID=1485682 RepID=A0A098VV81_9MICR|nr:uncharacterized protein DI09_12p100 [Mitosporidium daphniae]KGG52842.1 hypothetical protein DI09_12p100 [Mitosporidium daphniae]|eukprot:XP_013239269.1 uncharacterized protein DI09_12p100 [Mitosporidium daphniae]
MQSQSDMSDQNKFPASPNQCAPASPIDRQHTTTDHSAIYPTEPCHKTAQKLGLLSPKTRPTSYTPYRCAPAEAACHASSNMYSPRSGPPCISQNRELNLPSPAEDPLRLFSPDPHHINGYHSHFEPFKYPRQISHQTLPNFIQPGRFPPAVPTFPASGATQPDHYYPNDARTYRSSKQGRNR